MRGARPSGGRAVRGAPLCRLLRRCCPAVAVARLACCAACAHAMLLWGGGGFHSDHMHMGMDTFAGWRCSRKLSERASVRLCHRSLWL